MMYRDTIRPHGKPRSDATYQASLDYCYGKTGADRNGADTPAFKKCMRSVGYKWQYTRLIRTPEAPAPQRTYVDPDTGLACHDIVVFGVVGSSCSNF